MHAPKQYRSRAQSQSVDLDLDEAFLLHTNPVGKQAEFHEMDDRISPKLSDAEVLTMEVVGEFLGLDTDAGIHRYFRSHFVGWFPAIGSVHRTTFARQGANLWAAKERLWRHLRCSLEAAPSGEAGEVLVVDSMPMPACKGTRSRGCKILWDVADKGYAASQGGFFYGVRAHVLVRWPGVIVGTRLAPASTHDLHPAQALLAEAGAEGGGGYLATGTTTPRGWPRSSGGGDKSP